MITRLKTQYLISKLPPFVQQEDSCQVSSSSSLQWPLLGAKHFINPCMPQDRVLAVHLIKREDFLNFWVHFCQVSRKCLTGVESWPVVFPWKQFFVFLTWYIFFKEMWWQDVSFPKVSIHIEFIWFSLSFYHVGPRSWAQVIRLGIGSLHMPSHIDGPRWVHLNLCRDTSVFARLSMYLDTALPLIFFTQMAVYCMHAFLWTSWVSSQALSLH